MAFGFTPKFEQSLDLNGLNPEHYLVIALEAVKNLGWDTTNINEAGFTAFTRFSMRSWNEEVNVVIDGDTALLKSRCLGNQLIDWGKNKDNIENFIAEFDRVQSSMNEEQINEKQASLSTEIESGEANDLNVSPATSLGKAKSFASFFLPREGYYITPIIIDLNIVVFILMLLSGVSAFEPDSASLITWGADLRGLTLAGEWWRLLTSTFLHIGIFHIAFNMYALLYIGVLLEPYLGKLRFATAYLLTGLMASLTSIATHPNTISAGASGAIFGMYGVFLALLTTSIIDKKTRSALFASIGVFVAYNLMNGMKAGIDNAAHMGGLVTGLVIGYAYFPSLKKSDSKGIEYATILAVVTIVSVASVIMFSKIPNDIVKYDAKMKDFAKHEDMALDVLRSKDTSASVLSAGLTDKGIANWKYNLRLLDETDKLDLPQALKDRSFLLREYCESRIKEYNCMDKEIKGNTYQKDSIDYYNKQIKGLIDDLSGKK